MKRLASVARLIVGLFTLAFSACHKQATVAPPDSSLRADTVTVQFVGLESDSTLTVEGVPIYFYPFDRDSLFNELEAKARFPRPEIPESMLATFDRIRSLHEDWRIAEGEWLAIRDQLAALSDEMYSMGDSARSTPEYARKYDEWERLESREQRLNDGKKQIFEELTFMQDSITPEVKDYQRTLDAWEDEAYASYFQEEERLLLRLGRQVYSDTTDADGNVTRALPDGDWWVECRRPTRRGDFFWNVRIDPRSVRTLRLDESNGDERIRI